MQNGATHQDREKDRPAIQNIVRFAKGGLIYTQDEVAHSWYLILDGAVRTARYGENGQRYWTMIYRPEEVFGLDSRRYHSTAEAIENSRLQKFDSSLPLPSDLDWPSILKRTLSGAMRHLFTLSRPGARARVSAFLLSLRQWAPGDAMLTLPMSREAIADYLAITTSTTSRILHELEAARVIAIHTPRRIQIVDLARLSVLAAGTDTDTVVRGRSRKHFEQDEGTKK